MCLIIDIELTVILVLLLLVIVIGFRGWQCFDLKISLPPGPTRLPIIGNLLDMKTSSEWIHYHQWCQENSSDLMYFSAGSLSVLVLDRLQPVVELLEKRSALYSNSFSAWTNVCLRIGWNWSFPFRYEQWKEQRKIIHHEFHSKAVAQFHAQEIEAVRKMLQCLLYSPESWYHDLTQFLGALIMLTIYGIKVSSEDDPFIAVAKRATHTVSLATTPGRFFVEVIPLLKHLPTWLPFTRFKRSAVMWQADAIDSLLKPFAATKEMMASGATISSCASRGLQKLEGLADGHNKEEILQWALGSMSPGWSKHSMMLSALRSFFLEMTLHPNVQHKAQLELDNVLQHQRLPTFADRSSLPYISAVVMEVLRHHPIAPLGAPHATSADDTYQGYHIPAGTIVLPNIWAILHDPVQYPDPFVFNPDRFTSMSPYDGIARDPSAVFGFGRRICPGRHIALDVLWITVASILTVFTIDQPKDEAGNPVRPLVRYEDKGVIIHPLPFECNIQPRGQKETLLIGHAE
ncbi:cytochrome P450 [Lentinula lateritia]|uniref:Cytochrome P450 n=1 Tax=Lentinula lateritia TaxID=40482 RepID=A0ABQ8VEA3_9AGAR|nr:cytochrome P450 [Lentinula lateritia]